MKALALLVALLMPSLALAQTQAPLDADDVVPAPVEKSVLVPKAEVARLQISVPNVPGVYTLTIIAGSRPTLAVQPEIIVLDPDGPGPVPPPPVPGNLTDFGKAIKAAADKATGDADRVNTAQGLAMLYRAASKEAHTKGTAATVESLSNGILRITDLALGQQGAPAATAWEPMRTALRAAMVNAMATGNPGGKPLEVGQLGDLIDEAAAGLEASAPKTAAKAPSPAFWAFLEKLLLLLLPYLLPKV